MEASSAVLAKVVTKEMLTGVLSEQAYYQLLFQ